MRRRARLSSLRRGVKLSLLLCVLFVSTLFLHNYQVKAVDRISVTGVSIVDVSDSTLKIGTKLTLKAMVLPTNATKKTVSWSTSDPTVAKVSSSGVVTPVAEGQVTILVTTTDGGFTASKDFTVIRPVEKITLDEESITLDLNQSTTLTPEISPDNATDQTLIWSSTDSSVAQVDRNTGLITAVGTGTTIISAKSTRDSSVVASCTVVVPVHAASIEIIDRDRDDLNIRQIFKMGSKVNLGVSIVPANATIQTVTWFSSNERVAKISSKGVVTPVSPGTVTIKAVSDDNPNVTTTKIFQVVYSVTGLTLDEKAITIKAGNPPTTLTATIKPSRATNTGVIWTSSNPSVAAVDNNGSVTAPLGASGTAIITATSAEDSSIFSQCIVTVPVSVTSVDIINTDATLQKGSKLKLSTSVLPANATYKTLTWSSSDTKVAKVDSNGVVTAVSGGVVTIKATSNYGTAEGSITLTIVDKVSSVSLDKSSFILNEGEYTTLIPTIKPSTADQGLVWESSRPGVATIDEFGNVHALAYGSTVITVKSKLDSTKIDKCTVTVVIPITSLSIKDSPSTLDTGSSIALKLVITPSRAANQPITWQSSDTTIAKVDSSGVVTGIKPGYVTITATSHDKAHTTQVSLTVIKGVTGLTLNRSELTTKVGDTDVALKATVSPSNATDTRVEWRSNNTKVATVDSEGKVHAVGPGTATISAYSVANASIYASCVVKVLSPVTGLTLTSTTDVVDIGKSLTVKANIAPSNASNKNVKWTSSNESVATVSASGSVKGISPGSVKITGVTEDGGYKAYILITVYNGVNSLKLDKTSLNIRPGKESVILATVTPTSADFDFDRSLTWSSSNTNVATVDSTGTVHALVSGTAVITAKSNADPTKTAKCTVTVVVPVTGVTITPPTSRVLSVGSTISLRAVIAPTNATVKTFTWSSDDDSVATVSSSGSVKAIAPGTVTMTVTTDDGEYTGQITLTVQ